MQFSAGRAFTEAFQLLGTRFGMLVGVWLTFFVGILALFAAFGSMFIAAFAQANIGSGTGPGIGPGRNPFAGMGFSVIVFYVLYLAVLFAQQIALSRASTGRAEDSFAVSLGAGLRGALPMLGVMVIYLIAGIGGGVVFTLFAAGLVAATQSMGLNFLLGMALLLGFFYLFARLSLVLPVVAIDEVRNPIAAIGRAWKLTAGNSVKVALTWALALIAITALYFLVFMITVGFPGPGTLAGGPLQSIGFIVAMIVMGLSVGLYMVTLTTALYDQLSPSSAEMAAETFA